LKLIFTSDLQSPGRQGPALHRPQQSR
jgi:hypothetical protein